MRAGRFLLAFLMVISIAAADRINQEGRILGPLPSVTNSVLFNTPEADTVLASMQIFPVTSAWNEDISKRPVLGNSDAMVAQVISDLATNRRTLRVFFEMNFALVPDNQPLMPIQFFNYADESDPSPYPIPANLPIETWPKETGTLTLAEWQQDVANAGGDRHAIIVQPGVGFIWETWLTKITNGLWRASNGAKFDLKSNAQRPPGWTSGDAAGLAMFPALVRFDECERGAVEHALRLIVKKTRREYIYPASHFASTNSAAETNLPAMGQRFRLKQSFVTPSNWTRQETAVLYALKKYGAIVADNGNFFSVSATPDSRWPAGAFDHLSSINITNFEVIQTTGANEGPRSAGAPRAATGTLNLAPVGVAAELPGYVEFAGTPLPLTQWRVYSGPGAVTFSDAFKTNTTATFSAPGDYILMLSASDETHAVAYDSLHVTVASDFRLAISLAGSVAKLAWSGAAPSFIVEQTTSLTPPIWTDFLPTNSRSADIALTNHAEFFRVRYGP
jgi:hypothetical protein